MKNALIPPAELAEALSSSDPERRKAALKTLFDNTVLRNKAIAHVQRYGGNRPDGEDVFQEAVIVLDRKMRQGAFSVEVSLEAYFMGIVRWHWFNECQKRRKNHLVWFDGVPEPPEGGNPEIDYLLAERGEQLNNLMEKLQEKCRNILKMYQLDYSMDEIARALGFANGGVVKKEAFLCRQRFKALLATVPDLWQGMH